MSNPVKGLKQAKPYIHLYRNEIFVLKVGGGVLANQTSTKQLAEQISLLTDLGMKIIIVHGGGPQATAFTKKLGQEPVMVAGRRVTDDDALEVAKMIYAGKLNSEFVAVLNNNEVAAVGLSGIDGNTITATKRPPVNITDDDGENKIVDFGNVGDIDSINTKLLDNLLKDEFVPVLCCLGVGKNGNIYNINGDSIAQSLAMAMKARKLIFITNSDGLLSNPDDASSLIPFADKEELFTLINDGAINTGMRPKIDACINAVENGVERTHIINGHVEDALLIELFTGEGIGTMIVNTREEQK